MSLVTEEIRAKAEIHRGKDICHNQSKSLLEQMGFPSGVMPLKELEECGYVAETGFVWMKLQKNTVHKFEKIGKLVSYAPMVTAYIEQNRMKKLTGIKSKEILIWVAVSDISIDHATKKITFKTPTGLYRAFPASAFEEEVVTAGAVEASENVTVETVEVKRTVEVKEI